MGTDGVQQQQRQQSVSLNRVQAGEKGCESMREGGDESGATTPRAAIPPKRSYVDERVGLGRAREVVAEGGGGSAGPSQHLPSRNSPRGKLMVFGRVGYRNRRIANRRIGQRGDGV